MKNYNELYKLILIASQLHDSKTTKGKLKMTKDDALIILLINTLKNDIENNISFLNDSSKVLYELKYHKNQLNERLLDIVTRCKTLVDEFVGDSPYASFIELPRYVELNDMYLEDTILINLETLTIAKKVVNFMEGIFNKHLVESKV